MSVSAFHTSATGASKTRSTTSASSFVARLLFAFIFLLLSGFLVLALQLLEVAAQLVQALLPEAPVELDPVGDALERAGLQAAGAPLRFAAALDQARALEHLEVLGHRRQAHVEGLRDVEHRRFAGGEAREDRAPCWVGEGGEGGAEGVGGHIFNQ